MRASLALVCSLVALVAVPAAARAGDGVAILPLVGEDVQVIGVIDVKDARDSKMFEKGVQLMLDRATDMKDMLALVGLELENVDTVLVAGNYGTSGSMDDINQNLMAVIEGGFTKKKMIKALGGLSGVQVKKKRSVKYWVTADAEAAIIGKRLVVTQPGLMAGVIDRSKKKGKAFTKSSKAAALRAAVAYTNTGHDCWMVALPPSNIATKTKSYLKGDMVTYSIGVTLEASMTLETKVQVASATQASEMLTSLNKQLPGLKKLANAVGLPGLASSLSLTAVDAVLDLDAVLSASELEAVLELLADTNL